MRISIPYGRSALEAEVADRRVLARVAAPVSRAIEDPAQALHAAMQAPAGPALDEVVARGDRVLVMTVDHTRPNPSPVLWPLVERIEGLGGRPEIMIGLGNHRPMTPEELDGFLGGNLPVHQNDSGSPDQWRLGTTRHGSPMEVSPVLREFDRRIVVGFTEPHYIAGFSGGRKMVLPGVSSRRAISHNHFLTALHGPQLGVLDGNPVHEDMTQAALEVGVDWTCDVVVNPDDSFHSVHCGGLVAAHRQAAEEAGRLYGARVPRRADIVTCAAGGWPYDMDMVQAKKALAPALDCVRPGGVIILAGECKRGWGAVEADRDLLDPHTAPAARDTLVAQLRRGCVERNWAACSPGLLFARAVLDLGARLTVISRLAEDLAGTYLHTAPDLPSALADAEEVAGTDGSIILLPEGRRSICRPDMP